MTNDGKLVAANMLADTVDDDTSGLVVVIEADIFIVACGGT